MLPSRLSVGQPPKRAFSNVFAKGRRHFGVTLFNGRFARLASAPLARIDKYEGGESGSGDLLLVSSVGEKPVPLSCLSTRRAGLSPGTPSLGPLGRRLPLIHKRALLKSFVGKLASARAPQVDTTGRMSDAQDRAGVVMSNAPKRQTSQAQCGWRPGLRSAMVMTLKRNLVYRRE